MCAWVSELLTIDDEEHRERRRKITDRVIGYFSKHVGRLNYAERLKSGRAIGLGQLICPETAPTLRQALRAALGQPAAAAA